MYPEQAAVRVQTVWAAMVVVVVVMVGVVVESVVDVIVLSRTIVASVEESSAKPKLELTWSDMSVVVRP